MTDHGCNRPLHNVKLLQATYDSEEGLPRSLLLHVINSFAIREPDEYFWKIRAYGIAAQSGIKHFVYSGRYHFTRCQDHGLYDRVRRRVRGECAPTHEDAAGELRQDWVLENPSECIGKFVDAGAVMPISPEQWFEGASITADAPLPIGSSPDDPALFTFRKTFTAWWSMWRDNTAENEVTGRRPIPGEERITSIEEWMWSTD